MDAHATSKPASAHRSVADLGGPRPLPVLGNLPAFVRGGTPHRTLAGWRERYGATYRMRFPGRDVVVTSAPDIMDTVLRQRPTTFRRASFVSDLIDELGAHGLFNAEGQDWQRLRRVAMHGLNAKYLGESFATITRSAERLRDRWNASAGSRIDVVDDMLRYTLEVSVGLTMNYDLGATSGAGEDGLHRQLSQLFEALGRRLSSPVPYWRYVRLPADRRADAAVAGARTLILDRYAEAKRRMVRGDAPTDFLSALAKAEVDGDELVNDDDVVGNVLTMIVAGEDTTAAAASWVMHFLAAHPDVQRQVRAEADEVLGPGGSITEPPVLSRLRYAEAVVNEAIRLRPPTPYIVLEPVVDTTVTDGLDRLHIGAGTPIFLLLSHGSDDDTRQFPDPQSFRPQRWLTDGTARATSQPYLPFGGGPRFCPGRNLALMEATLIAAMTCQAFTIGPDTSAGPVGERVTFAVFPTNLGVRLQPNLP
ncbi:cytochrome P450 [Kibdelosporangium aridum]|uniref:cytochrome P450 n=1 Tax=Kibdelosporangium aridum TaxID=2030 RepID=UPI0035F06AD9